MSAAAATTPALVAKPQQEVLGNMKRVGTIELVETIELDNGKKFISLMLETTAGDIVQLSDWTGKNEYADDDSVTLFTQRVRVTNDAGSREYENVIKSK